MMYDDVDMNILDSKDTFGVIKTSEMRSDEERNVDFKSKRTPKHETKSKLPRKRTDDDIEIVSETKKYSRKKDDDLDLVSELKFKLARKKFDDDRKKFDDDRKKCDDDGRKKDDEPKPEISSEFKHKTAITFQEKLSVLEERDKYLRESVFKTGNKNMSVIVNGTCPDMCPEKERLLREIYCSFSIFEGQVVDNEMHVVPELLVKEYSRSSADQDEPLPHELRPEPVLIDTMNHIVVNIMPKIEENIDVSEWYHFCWDRLRSLRKDIIQQQLCSRRIVEILEKSARFHICCGDLLFGADPKVFDEKINAENLVNCLQMLINMYEDLEKKGIRCENESEFRIYMMLLLLDSGDIPDVVRWNDENSKQYARQAKEIFFAFKQNLYTRFFKLVKKTSYLNACILQRYFSAVKTQILTILVNSYSSGSQTSKFPLSFVKKILEFDSDEETISFIESHGFTVNYHSNEVRGSKSSFTIPEIKVQCGSSYILRSKRLPVLEAVSKIPGYSPKRTLTKVHSSFNQCDKLNENAWLAEDQKQKVIELFGDIYSGDSHDGPRTPTPISPQSFTIKLDPKPTLTPCKENIPPKESLTSFTFQKPEIPVIKTPPASFSFTLPKFDPAPVNESIHIKEPIDVPISPKIKSPRIEEIYDPEETTSSDEEYSEITEPVTIRESEEILDSLTSALQQFENLYSNFFQATREHDESLIRLRTLKENRRLRRTVKKRLKRNNAKKYARIWRQKIDSIRKKREDFVDIVHIPFDQYITLWGTLKNADDLPKSIVKYAKDTQRTVHWSSNIIAGKSLSVNYIGDKLSELLVNHVRARSNKLKLKMKSIICWKLLLHLPTSNTESFHSFVSKVSEFCQVLFYKNTPHLGAIESTLINGVKVSSSVDVRTGPCQVPGLTSLLVYVCEKQETIDEFLRRLTSLVTSLSHPLFVTIIAVNNCYKDGALEVLRRFKKTKRILGWNYSKWENFFTIPKAILNAAYYIPFTPSFEIKSLTQFIESTSGDFFLNLCYLWNNSLPNTPLTYINLYNVFLLKLREALATETHQKYNLAPDFLPHICGDNTRNTLTEPELISLISKYALIGFTKWPPKSTAKMVKLLTKYCNAINNEDSTFLPNIIRLVGPKDDADVETITKTAPWIKVVELWSKYNVFAILEREHDLKNVFVVYDQSKIQQITDGLWIYNAVQNYQTGST